MDGNAFFVLPVDGSIPAWEYCAPSAVKNHVACYNADGVLTGGSSACEEDKL